MGRFRPLADVRPFEFGTQGVFRAFYCMDPNMISRMPAWFVTLIGR